MSATLKASSAQPLQSLALNAVLSYQGQLVRLLAASPLANVAHVIDLNSETALPVLVKYSDLRKEGISEEDPAWNRPLNESSACQKVREARYKRIRDLVTEPEILFAKTRGPLLTKHSTKVGVSKKTLLTDLRAWWQRGQVKDALLGDYFRSGRLTDATPGALLHDEKSTDGVKHVVMAPCRGEARGRRPIDGNYTPMQLSNDEKLQIIKVGKAKYQSDRTVSIRSVVANVLLELYALKDADGKPKVTKEGKVEMPPLGRRPTNRQIGYLLSSVLSVSKTYSRRHGIAEFLNNKAPTTGTVMEDCTGPGDVYEADETTLDFHVVSETDITITLGKPILHIVVDRYTRLIVGFHVSLDAASWEDGKLALMSVANDWKALCEKHGITYFAADFPAQGVMCNRLFGDRGLLMTFASDCLAYIGNDTTNAPALLSRSKPIVESTFRRFNKLLTELPGHEPQWNVHKRRAKPYEKDACLTLKQLEGVLLRAVIALNREILEDYPQRAIDTKNGLLPIPRELWVRESERLNSLPRRISREWLQRNLLSTEIALVTQDGIKFRENFYTCKEAVQKDWFAIASTAAPFNINVRFTPKNLDQILVEDPKNPGLQYTANLTGKSQRLVGENPSLTDTESKAVAAGARGIRRKAEFHNEDQRVSFIAETSAIVQEAKATVQAAVKGKSLASRKKAAAEKRQTESENSRKDIHQVTPEASKPSEAPNETAPPPIDESTQAGQPIHSIDPVIATDFLEFLKAIQQ